MGHLSDEELLQLRRRTKTDIWLNDVEDFISVPNIRQKYINLLQQIDEELLRRGFTFA